MAGTGKTTLFGACLFTAITVVRGEENTAVIAASAIAGLLLLILFVGLTVYCFYRRGSLSTEKKKPKSKKPPHQHANGYHPQYKERHHHHHANGFSKTNLPPRVVQPRAGPPPMYSYKTYSGPPPEARHHSYDRYKHGTVSGPPPVAIIPTQFGSVAVRPDPRPVVHSNKYRKNHKSPARGERRSREQPHEFIVQPSYDGIPVVRPVIYVDDDDKRLRHRSKSRDRKSHERQSQAKESSSSEPRVIEIKTDPSPFTRTHRWDESEPEPMSEPEPSQAVYRAASPSPTPQPKATPARSRASSVTEAVNALRMSVQDHLDDDDEDTDSSHSSKPTSPRWTVDRRSAKTPAPEPAAGDVMFFPAGQQVETERHVAAPSTSYAEYGYSKSIRASGREAPERPPHAYVSTEDESKAPDPHSNNDQIYSYSKVIRQSKKDGSGGLSSTANQGYEVPSQLRTSTREDSTYETEHTRPTTNYQGIGASMSDRLTTLVEDGDKTRATHYNVGAMNFGTEQDEPVQMRRTRPRTPPSDIPRSSLIYSRPHRPATPPNDIPLITPRESTEIPPLNLRSSATSPRTDYLSTGRPDTPPQDFPITPKSSIVRPRPSTEPLEPTNQIPPNTGRSASIDPSTGEPGSFQARQRLIEAHLQKNVGSSPADKTATAQFTKQAETVSKFEPVRPEAKVDTTPAPSFPLGYIPPPPPPPPLPK